MASSKILSKFHHNFFDDYVAGLMIGDEQVYFESSNINNNDEIYDLASLTKVLVTSQIIFSMIFENDFKLSSKISEILSSDDCQYFGEKISQLSIGSLLSHNSGLPAWRNFWVNHLDERAASHFTCRKVGQERWHLIGNEIDSTHPTVGLYSDVGYILLGEVIEKLKKKPINDAFYDFITEYDLLSKDFKTELLFAADLNRSQNIVKTSYCPLRDRLLLGEVHDENSASFGSLTGHAGLFGSYRALKDYLERLFKSDIFSLQFEHCEKVALESSFLFGWRRGSGESSKNYANGRSYGHLGFTGTSVWFEPQVGGAKSTQILLTNRVCKSRLNPNFVKARGEFSSFCEKIRQKH